MNDQCWSHEQSYEGVSFAAFIHRARLRILVSVLTHADLPHSGALVDFGCSNGFIIEQLQQRLFKGSWLFRGFDHKPELLDIARKKAIPGATFAQLDLNKPGSAPKSIYDLALCLETLEHTGNYREATRNVLGSCKIGGTVLISVPNETGIPGFVKLLGRRLVRRDPYGDFFANHSALAYAWTVLRHGNIERFRLPSREGWGPHLGFDVDSFEGWLADEFGPRFSFIKRRKVAFDFNRMYLLRRQQ